MQYSSLGASGLKVSRICLGTMTWGLQNTQEDANQQLAYALDKGVNFIDTAEMYAVPPSAETYGKTETILGRWLASNKNKRQDLVIASKIAGKGVPYIRGGSDITGAAVTKAIDDSLQRLQTDYLDLYQLHWSNRPHPHFGRHHPNQIKFTDVDRAAERDNFLDILQAIGQAVSEGKIRHFGLSDDTPWGIESYLKLADEFNLPRVNSIQNEFNLLHSKDWPYLIETCVHNDIAFLPWSPLAGGMLTGKYLDGQRPAGSRWTMSQRNGLFRNTQASDAAIRGYIEVAKAHNITPAQLALAWCNQVDGVTSTIIGATSLAQLEEDIAAFDISLTEQCLTQIGQVLNQYLAPF
ncbi:aldo/keto reductase [Gayadomonas joobiniege]|uniref:aldo/keto reductase n=1 Tax=Gayadomonas joobiniege TaxID=1234606 RepID=UPI00058D035E|nr:aldo/keto reductase [Gayadomonas joobiniege]